MCSEVRRHVEVKLHGPLEEPETKVNVKLLVNSKKMLEKQKLEEDVGEAEAEANPTTIILLRHHRSIQ